MRVDIAKRARRPERRASQARPFAKSPTPALTPFLKTPLLRIAARTTVLDALEVAQRAGSHHLTLFDGTVLLGVICTCDLEDLPLEAQVGRALLRPPVLIDESQSVEAALARMSEKIVGSVLVTRAGEPIGLVTREDLAPLATAPLPNLCCDSCGAVAHLRQGEKGLLCLDCQSRAHPAAPDDDELGGSG
jgi:CBS domain-containing protein